MCERTLSRALRRSRPLTRKSLALTSHLTLRSQRRATARKEATCRLAYYIRRS